MTLNWKTNKSKLKWLDQNDNMAKIGMVTFQNMRSFKFEKKLHRLEKNDKYVSFD
jgi:hypothetical protein